MSELTNLYRKITGLTYINVEKEFSKAHNNAEKSIIYRRLIWNIPRGAYLNYTTKPQKTFEVADLICRLALYANLDLEKEDVIEDGLITYDDKFVLKDLSLAHEIIKRCAHFEEIIHLITEDGVHIILDTFDNEDNKISLDKI